MIAEKECSICHEVKPASEFHKSARDGLQPYCKPCRREYDKAYHPKRNYDTEGRKRYRKRVRKTKAYQEAMRKYRRRYARRNREKARAWEAVHNATIRGDLKPASERKCKHCGGPADEYHHHRGYSKEHRLDVIPLCKDCHVAVHYQ